MTPGKYSIFRMMIHLKRAYRSLGITAFISLLICASAIAQNELTVEYVHEKTQEYFDNQEWNKLIRMGERALKNGIESYLLRARLGTAYFELEEYAHAIPHFRKAVNTGYSDGIIKRNLYYSCMFMGREEDANDVFFDMSDSRQESIKPLTNDFIYDLAGGGMFSGTNDLERNGDLDLDGGSNEFGEQTLNGSESGFGIGLSQLPLRWLKISYAFGYLNSQREKQYMFGDQRVSDKYNQKQGRLFNEFSFRAAQGLVIYAAGHYVKTSENTTMASFDNLGYTASQSYGLIRGTIPSIRDTLIEQKDFVLSATVYRWFSVFRAGISGSFSYLNGEHQTQAGLSLQAFPQKKPDFFVSATATLHTQNSVSNLIITPALGYKFGEKFRLEGFGSFGRMGNYNESNGFVIYNNPDVIKLKYGISLQYDFLFNLTAALSYTGQQREKKYSTYTQTASGKGTSAFTHVYSTADYSANSLSLFLRYSF